MILFIYFFFSEAVLGVELEQKDLSMTKVEGKTVSISCKVTGLTTSYVHWYQKKEDEALKRILYVKKGSSAVPDNSHPEAKDFDVRIQSDNYDLKITNLKKSHSAVYYCA
ncbi:Ig heavy chain V region 914, partial [Silurus meridionalis]